MADGELTAKEGGGERKLKRGAEFSSSSSSQSAAAVEAKWRTEGEQRTYSSRLIAALRRVRSSAPAASDRAQSRALREAADRALAVSARGRTRWSRAILLSGKVRSLKRRRVLRPRAATRAKPPAAAAGSSRPPALEKKTRVLGRLVPGCRKLPLPSLLEEVSDYIKALQMQVRAMSAITEVLSAASAAPSPPPPSPPPPPM